MSIVEVNFGKRKSPVQLQVCGSPRALVYPRWGNLYYEDRRYLYDRIFWIVLAVFKLPRWLSGKKVVLMWCVHRSTGVRYVPFSYWNLNNLDIVSVREFGRRFTKVPTDKARTRIQESFQKRGAWRCF